MVLLGAASSDAAQGEVVNRLRKMLYQVVDDPGHVQQADGRPAPSTIGKRRYPPVAIFCTARPRRIAGLNGNWLGSHDFFDGRGQIDLCAITFRASRSVKTPIKIPSRQMSAL